MKNRLRELRQRLNLSLEEVAQKAGTSNQMVGMLERGDRKLTHEWMERLAPALNAKPADLLPVASTHHSIKVGGEVQAGLWRPPNEHWADDEVLEIPLPEQFQGLRLFALRVRGPSMNLIYPEGTLLICGHLEELHEEPIAGKRYIIEDIDEADGIETTVKELALDDEGRPWAWPRSTHPEHQQPIALDKGRPGHTIRTKARVVFSLKGE
ncbi:MAG: LexA family transcriptional regulator [Aestuariivirga sp.]